MSAEAPGHGRAESGPTCSPAHDVASPGRRLHLGTQALTAGSPCPQGLMQWIPATMGSFWMLERGAPSPGARWERRASGQNASQGRSLGFTQSRAILTSSGWAGRTMPPGLKTTANQNHFCQ